MYSEFLEMVQEQDDWRFNNEKKHYYPEVYTGYHNSWLNDLKEIDDTSSDNWIHRNMYRNQNENQQQEAN